jgi:DNA (cytosine-5)-methyltransferase 1
VVINDTLKRELCNDLIKNGKVKENDVIRHSYTNSRMNGEMKDLKQNNLSPTLDTRCDCLGVVNNLRIRKLTPKECFRLQGVKDEDFERCAKNQSNASLYHLAGDSIVVNVLMAIFKELIK